MRCPPSIPPLHPPGTPGLRRVAEPQQHRASGDVDAADSGTGEGPRGFAHVCGLPPGSTCAGRSETHACALPGLRTRLPQPTPLLPGAASRPEQGWDPLTILLPAFRHSCQLVVLLAQLPQLLPLLLQLVFQLQHPHLKDITHAMGTLRPGTAPGCSGWHGAVLGWATPSHTHYLPNIEPKDHRGTSHERSDGKWSWGGD